MFIRLATGLLIIFVIVWAVRSRVFLKKTRGLEAGSTVASPASLALAELAAVAGGIYLSLILLQTFLKLSVPQEVTVLNMPLDPIALLAIVIALLQPIGSALLQRVTRR